MIKTIALANQKVETLKTVRNGDFSLRLPEDNGLGEVASLSNQIIVTNQNFANEIDRII